MEVKTERELRQPPDSDHSLSPGRRSKLSSVSPGHPAVRVEVSPPIIQVGPDLSRPQTTSFDLGTAATLPVSSAARPDGVRAGAKLALLATRSSQRQLSLTPADSSRFVKAGEKPAAPARVFALWKSMNPLIGSAAPTRPSDRN